LARDQLLQVLRIARARTSTAGSACAIAQVIGAQRDARRADILLETMQRRRAGHRHDPRILRERPGDAICAAAADPPDRFPASRHELPRR